MKTLFRYVLLLVVTGLPAWQAVAQITYNQATTSIFIPGTNPIETDATTNTWSNFKTNVAAAWTNGAGGVLNFPSGIANDTLLFRGTYTTNKRVHVTSSAIMQNITSGSFMVASAGNGTTSRTNSADYTLTFSLFNTNGLPLTDETVKQVGLPILSRNTVAYPLDMVVTCTYSDNSTHSITSNIANGVGTDDTFFGFSAPEGLGILSLRLQSFVANTVPPASTPVSDRIGWDDLGFITGPASVTPQPQIVNVTPAAYSIVNPATGIQFNALTYVSIPTNNISVVINSNNVSNQLIITGSATNYSVAYNGLVAGQEYQVTIAVTNGGGVAVFQTGFYTITNGIVLYDSDSFTNDTLYPLGPLGNVTEDRATWLPAAVEPAQIVNGASPYDKVLERQATGVVRADTLVFQPFSSGRIIIEFDAFISTTAGRTIDLSLQPTSGGTAMASFLAWGEPVGKLAYFDNVNWVPLVDLPTEWHHVTITNYLSGAAGGTYDVSVNGTAVAQRIGWRNAAVGSVFNQLRLQTAATSPLFTFGQIDNLVVIAAPEDPNVIAAPQIANFSQGNNIIGPGSNFQFTVTSAVPISGTNITVLLNSNIITSGIIFSGPATNLLASYSLVTNGTYNFEVQAYNAAGTNTVTATRFIVTDEAWMLHPGDGWVSPWQWNAGTPELFQANPLDTPPAYLHLNTTGGARNFMREYQSGTVNINQPHYIRWKFRMTEADFLANYTTANDRVHFFAHPVSRITASTTTGNSWAIVASGGPNADVTMTQAFYVYDNADGSSAFTGVNHVNSEILVVPDHIYSFEVLVRPAQTNYDVKIVDETASLTFTNTTPLRFRDLVGTSHTFLHFGVQADVGTDARSFDLDSVFVTQAALPATPVTLVNPVHSGGNFSFSFQSQTGVNYVTRYLGNLSSSSWTSLVTNVGTGSLLTVTHTNVPTGPLFYRVESTQ